uniref:Uncharacterized protein n=1 Tax=Molossus molossus TaxID=27622 RepID=A0A7J8DPU9_MOLMO|nr:hypothetical protein HJG59_009271 [Molossus molossus]
MPLMKYLIPCTPGLPWGAHLHHHLVKWGTAVELSSLKPETGSVRCGTIDQPNFWGAPVLGSLEGQKGPGQAPQAVALWHVDCFELKAMETLWAHEKPLPLPCKFKLVALPTIRLIIRNNFSRPPNRAQQASNY